ncbi:hypothetical protein GCM10010442_49490 [Kitasatospora kifunensis]
MLDLGRGMAPLVVVVPRQRPLSARLALAAGDALWRHRAAMAPSWAGLGVFTAAGLLSVAAPASSLLFGSAAVLLPAGWVVVKRRHPRSAVRRKARANAQAVAAWSAGLAWSAAAVWAGPATATLGLLWLAGTLTAQFLWWRRRRVDHALAGAPVIPGKSTNTGATADAVSFDKPTHH